MQVKKKEKVFVFSLTRLTRQNLANRYTTKYNATQRNNATQRQKNTTLPFVTSPLPVVSRPRHRPRTYVCVCMYVCICMFAWVSAWVNECMQLSEWVSERVSEWTNASEWSDKWVSKCMWVSKKLIKTMHRKHNENHIKTIFMNCILVTERFFKNGRGSFKRTTWG